TAVAVPTVTGPAATLSAATLASADGATSPPAQPLPELRVRRAPRSLPTPSAVLRPAERNTRAPLGGPRYVQDALAVESRTTGSDADFDRLPTSMEDLPDPRRWAIHMARAVTEVMQGQRAPTQLLRWTSSEVYAVVARRSGVAARRAAAERARGVDRARRPVRIRRVVTCLPTPEVIEAAVIVEDGPRVRAMALRFAGLDGRWVLTALQTG
uniref:Rv3235 family protein n=1 Tax=Kribbia dieselivorans TaxID=331526 RepID=UPI001470052C